VTPFDRSAAFYDLLYEELPTRDELDFVLTRFDAHGLRPRSVIDLGCGTGRHAVDLAERGIEVVGLDRSEPMVARARSRGVDARVGDLTSARLGRTFDAAIALFHVFAYAVTDRDLAAFIGTARAHLDVGGLLAFDTWNAEAVAFSPPAAREKRIKSEGRRVVRRATPRVDGEVIEIRFEFETDHESFVELHTVRPRSRALLEDHLLRGGFRVREVVTSADRCDYNLSVFAEAR
jgi:SAM-dependent methyltransferase